MPTVTGRATDYITFSRASNATVTDSNGYIKWAAHNLLLASEQFDASNWLKTGSATTANSVVAPNGTTTADVISEDTANNVHSVSQSFTAGAIYTYSVYLKYNNLQYVTLSLNNNSVSTEWASAVFDVQNGIVASQNAATITIVGTPTITAVGSGWYLCTISANLSAITTGQVYLAAANASTGATFRGAQTYTGSSRSFYAWGAHVYRSDLGGMVANTSAYPYYNPTTPKNLLGYTEDFSNAAWSKTASSVTANTIVAPNGLQTGDTYTADGTSSPHRMEQIASSGYQKFFSFYAKAGTNNFVQVFFGGDAAPWANFNLSTGAVGSTGSNQTAAIADAGNGWYRCSVYTSSSTATNVAIAIVSSASAARNETNTLTTSIYLWGAQLSDSASLDTYVPNNFAAPTAAAYYGPRLDYDGSTLAAKGLLVEEQRTNLLLRSQEFNTTWIASALNTTGTPAWVNAGIAPDGTATADAMIPNTTIALHYLSQSPSRTTGNYTYSVYAKSFGYNFFAIQIRDLAGAYKNAQFNISTGAVVSSNGAVSTSIQSVGNGWYRCVFTFDNATGVTTSNDAIFVGSVANNWNSGFVGDGTSGVLIWGAQLEAGSFATSYIPTTSATVTRSADVAQVSTQAFPYSQTEGTLVANGTFMGLGLAPSSGIASLTDGTVNNNIAFFRVSGSSNLKGEMLSGGSSQASYTVAMGVQPSKAAFAYAANNSNFALNGTAQTDDTICTVPTMNQMLIGATYTAGNLPMNGWVRQITYLPRRITNAELQTRTS